jgi:hypothetical protein
MDWRRTLSNYRCMNFSDHTLRYKLRAMILLEYGFKWIIRVTRMFNMTQTYFNSVRILKFYLSTGQFYNISPTHSSPSSLQLKNVHTLL